MHAQQHTRALGDRALVIGKRGAVGGAHLAQRCAAFGHDVGYAERFANLDELATRHDGFPASRQRREHQEYRGSIVVDRNRGFRARQSRKQFRRVHIPPAARARLQIVFKVAVAAGRFLDALDRGRRKRCPAKICVQDDARGVDHRAQRWCERGGDLAQHRFRECLRLGAGIRTHGVRLRLHSASAAIARGRPCGGESRHSAIDHCALPFEHGARGVDKQRAIYARANFCQARRGYQLVYRRKPAQRSTPLSRGTSGQTRSFFRAALFGRQVAAFCRIYNPIHRPVLNPIHRPVLNPIHRPIHRSIRRAIERRRFHRARYFSTANLLEQPRPRPRCR